MLSISNIGSIHVCGIPLGMTLADASEKIKCNISQSEDWGIVAKNAYKLESALPAMSVLFVAGKDKRIYGITIMSPFEGLTNLEKDKIDKHFRTKFGIFPILLSETNDSQVTFTSTLHTIRITCRQTENCFNYSVNIEGRLMKATDEEQIKERMRDIYLSKPHPWHSYSGDNKTQWDIGRKIIIGCTVIVGIVFGILALLNGRYVPTNHDGHMGVFDQWKGEYVNMTFHHR